MEDRLNGKFLSYIKDLNIPNGVTTILCERSKDLALIEKELFGDPACEFRKLKIYNPDDPCHSNPDVIDDFLDQIDPPDVDGVTETYNTKGFFLTLKRVFGGMQSDYVILIKAPTDVEVSPDKNPQTFAIKNLYAFTMPAFNEGSFTNSQALAIGEKEEILNKTRKTLFGEQETGEATKSSLLLAEAKVEAPEDRVLASLLARKSTIFDQVKLKGEQQGGAKCPEGHLLSQCDGGGGGWVCYLCGESKAGGWGWRCSQDKRWGQGGGCAYDVCNGCVQEYQVQEEEDVLVKDDTSQGYLEKPAGEQPIFTCKAHVFHIDPKTKRSWISASNSAAPVSFFYDSSRALYGIISVEGTKAVINSTITPNMTFTKTSQKFGQWSDVRANTVYGLGFGSEGELNKFIEKFAEVKEATSRAVGSKVRRQSSVEGLVRMKALETDTYNSLVRSLFCSLLSLGPDTMKELWPGKKKKRSNAGTHLTEDRVTAIYKLIEYLGLDTSVQEEGVFRKNAAVKKKDELLQRLEEEQQLDLYQEQFTVHEAASALKSLLAGLAEPPMTDCCFPALCSLATRERGLWLQGVRLLLQLVPGSESRLLKDLLHMLHGTAAQETANRMSSSSLATIFMTHLVCPRWLPPEKLQALYSPLTALTTFMVEEAEQLFLVPPELVSAVEDITRRRSSQGCVSPARQEEASGVSSLIASTVFSFVERGNCLEEGDPVLTPTQDTQANFGPELPTSNWGPEGVKKMGGRCHQGKN